MDLFLQRLKPAFEIILFSDLEKEITDKIIEEIERDEKVFHHRLYRRHMCFSPSSSDFVKPIEKISRNLNKTIIIDHNPNLYEEESKNLITVPSFRPPPSEPLQKLNKENSLLTALRTLETLAKNNPDSLTNALKSKESQLEEIREMSSIEESSITVSR
jgi:TFIIF-interacting CTD phosphatase-like protein